MREAVCNTASHHNVVVCRRRQVVDLARQRRGVLRRIGAPMSYPQREATTASAWTQDERTHSVFSAGASACL